MPNVSVPLQLTNDVISSSSTALAGGVLSAAVITVGINTSSPNLTAFATNVATSQSNGGAPIFNTGVLGSIFSTVNPTGTQTLKNTAGTAVGTTVSVSAVGNDCAFGTQTLVYTVSLSSQALSGNGAGTVVIADVTNTTQTLSTTLNAVNTPFGNKACRAEFSRLRLLEQI